MNTYVHGYDNSAGERLDDQADALVRLIHDGTKYLESERVLEVGCGVGSQTTTLVARHPGAHFTCIDVSATSLAAAREKFSGRSSNLDFHQASVLDLAFEDDAFDHAFICFVLEHLAEPVAALQEVKRVVKPGGTITVIEGDHGSVIMHPERATAHEAIACQVELQKRGGGNALIGRTLYPILVSASLEHVAVEARQVFAHGGTPALADAFTLKTFMAMIAAVREDALTAGLITSERFDDGIDALEAAATPEGAFAYTFFKAEAYVPNLTKDPAD